ncbi:ATP-binding protein [Sphingomonas hengshuiensis]|uniref:ATP-binding protein n=1 Tax=Sphingomonas hengshuiensis TaxID=1609977 RepID=UPI0005C9FF75|nr:ATP-binding protein [Sphingomonas hengshuiensis]
MNDAVLFVERPARTAGWRIWILGALAVLGIAVLVALIVIQQRADVERDKAITLQQHTFEVIIRANQLSAAVASAEAALGRYVVSADKTLGQQYAGYWQRAGEQLARLQHLTADNPEQQKRLAALRRAFDARGKELNETALYSSYKRHRDAWGAYYQVRQGPARQDVEMLLQHVVDSERGLLRERTQAASDLIASSSLASRVLTAFGIVIVLAAVLLGWLAVQAEGERAAADAEAHSQRERAAELRQAVDSATAQLLAEAREREAAEAQLRQVQKMEAVGQLTGGIAHDFNNMLAVVVGGLELAKRHVQTGGGAALRHIDNAMEGANRAAALTRRLLAFARSETLMPEAVDPDALIAGMSDLLDRTLGDTVSVHTEGGSAGWRIWVDRHQLENALLNLAVNARDAMEGRGALTISTGQATLAEGERSECAAGDYMRITVADTGCGMTPEVLDRVFEPFFTTKPVGKGTGLGLSQIFGFVRQSGGEIAIQTAPGAGTRVTLYLPRHHGEAVQPGVEAAVAPASPAAPSHAILVVEDDPRVLAATVSALEELGHRPTPCADPLLAPSLLAAIGPVDLILSDVLMPGQTGPEMIAGLGDRIADVAVLFVTGFAGDADAEMLVGFPVLRKPYTLAGLARAIDGALAQAGARALG